MPSLQPYHLIVAFPRVTRQQRRHRRVIYTRHIGCFRLPPGGQFIETGAQRGVPHQTMPSSVTRTMSADRGSSAQAKAIGYLQL
jgi:hypothetical protein